MIIDRILKLKENKKKRQKEEILEFLTEYIAEGCYSETQIIELIAITLQENFSMRWKKAEKLADELVDELWCEAYFNAKVEQQEAEEWYKAREEARRGY